MLLRAGTLWLSLISETQHQGGPRVPSLHTWVSPPDQNAHQLLQKEAHSPAVSTHTHSWVLRSWSSMKDSAVILHLHHNSHELLKTALPNAPLSEGSASAHGTSEGFLDLLSELLIYLLIKVWHQLTRSLLGSFSSLRLQTSLGTTGPCPSPLPLF